MNFYNKLFLEALAASLQGKKLQWNTDISPKDWNSLFEQSRVHKVTPLIYGAIYDCPAFKKTDAGFQESFKRHTIGQATQQTVKTAAFLRLQKAMLAAGFTPIVVKGIVCRNLYPYPDYRVSSDEDILIASEKFADCAAFLKDYGMQRMKEEQDEKKAFEVSFIHKDSPIYIELHRALFDPESDVYGEWNRYFADAFACKVMIEADGQKVYTLSYTEHLFYLICHAFKHFLHSGFGIRQVCDMVMFANAYGTQVDWEKVMTWCQEIRAEKFCVALFKIGYKYLGFLPQEAEYPTRWSEMDVDETDLLEDLLSGGVYGGSSRSRMHSSNMTLNAVSAHKKGKQANGNVLRVVFPPAKQLEGRYAFLVERPYLVPFAWMDRILKYRKEISRGQDSDAMESVRIGNERIALLRQYGVIEKED